MYTVQYISDKESPPKARVITTQTDKTLMRQEREREERGEGGREGTLAKVGGTCRRY